MSEYYKVKDVEIALVFSGLCDGKTCKEVREVLNSIPTIDRPQGEWIDISEWYAPRQKCSICETIVDGYGSNFCPDCGAKMKGADDETNY